MSTPNSQATTLVTNITQEGYQKALQNAPNRNGFRIELTQVDVYTNNIKKGRFPVFGVVADARRNHLRVRGKITSTSEEYSYNRIDLIDGISGVVFATVKRPDNNVIDFVSPHKESTFSFDLTFSSVAADRITIAPDNTGQSAALAEFDRHRDDLNAHASLFAEKVSKFGDTMTGNLTIHYPYPKIFLKNSSGYKGVFETHPHGNNQIWGSLIYRDPSDSNLYTLNLPKKNGTLAILENTVNVKPHFTGNVNDLLGTNQIVAIYGKTNVNNLPDNAYGYGTIIATSSEESKNLLYLTHTGEV